MPSPQPLPRVEAVRPDRRVGRRLLLFDALPSTNDSAAALAADPANDGTVVAAAFQTAGRGQHGRAWHSRPGASVLMSALVFPPPAAARPVVLTAWAAVSVAAVVREIAGGDPRIKWPNDVQVGGRKVSGVLVERGRGTVVGIGLNVGQSADELAAAGLAGATSLAAVAGRSFDPADVLDRLVGRLDDEYRRLLAGDPAALEAAWRAALGLLGRPVVVERTDGATAVGTLVRLGFDRVEWDGGSARPEAVRHLWPAG